MSHGTPVGPNNGRMSIAGYLPKNRRPKTWRGVVVNTLVLINEVALHI